MGGGEDEAELVGDVVAGEGGAGGAFPEDYAVVDRGDGCGGSADVDDQGGGFAGGKAGEKEVIQLGRGEGGGTGQELTRRERRFSRARKLERPNSPWRFQLAFPCLYPCSSRFLS